jgi:hypothetical protein
MPYAMEISNLLRILKRYFSRDILNRLNDLETTLYVFINSPTYDHREDVGFNGQKGKKQIFAELLDNFDFRYLIETGSFVGDTTGFMARRAKLPVLSSELNPHFYSLAKLRLKSLPSVSLSNLDSRVFLRNLAERPEITQQECFIYLDAHWGRDCPLREEIAIIASCWEKFIIMIDDFQVPGDYGYGYDRFGTFTKLNLAYIRAELKRFDLHTYFPRLPSAEETGAPSGCVILSKGEQITHALTRIPSLRRHQY